MVLLALFAFIKGTARNRKIMLCYKIFNISIENSNYRIGILIMDVSVPDDRLWILNKEYQNEWVNFIARKVNGRRCLRETKVKVPPNTLARLSRRHRGKLRIFLPTLYTMPFILNWTRFLVITLCNYISCMSLM